MTKQCNKSLNVIRFLRGTWWEWDPQTLLLIYKTLIRAKIDYGCNWYYPINKSHRRRQEPVQHEAIRLALGYRRTTPINVIHAEAKLPSIMDRAIYLGAKYLIRILANRLHPLIETLEDFCQTYQMQYLTHRPLTSRDWSGLYILSKNISPTLKHSPISRATSTTMQRNSRNPT